MKKIIIFLSVFLLGCSKDATEVEFVYAEISAYYEKGKKYLDNYEMDCLKIKISGEKDWKLIDPKLIIGFNYEEGYQYLLRLEVIPQSNNVWDDNPIKYKLIEIVTKEKK